MAYKNREDQRAASRRHYAAHREQVIAKVAERRHTAYAGVCRNCGGPTVGQAKNSIPEWCAKSACAAEQRNGQRRLKIRKAVAVWNVRDD